VLQRERADAVTEAPPPVGVRPRDRLRNEIKRERELTDRVLAAYGRVVNERNKKDAAITAADERIAASTARLADALIAYTETGGARPERAAVVLGVPKSAIVSMIRERRAEIRRAHAEALSNQGLERMLKA
jgi:hypothetical protein